MPIIRSYMCNECGHYMNVTLTAEQWDDPAPNCPKCVWADEPKFDRMQQEFKAPGIVSQHSKAEKVAEDIMRTDYHVNNYQRDKHEQMPKVSYQTPTGSSWGAARETLEAAIRSGRETRMRHGSGLDILQQNLKSGAEPDLIEISKKRAMRIY